MMGLGRADTDTMSLWEYEARLFHWNEAHGSGDDIGAPDPATAQRIIDMANKDPRLTKGKPRARRRQGA